MEIKTLHRWNVTPKEAIEIQLDLQKMIGTGDLLKEICLVAGADASFTKKGGSIQAVVCVLSFPDLELMEKTTATLRLAFPYIPGLLSFREGPVLLECFKKVKNVPDVVIFDGQGIAHPRRMGIATHLGLLLDIPSIGCAKTHLYGKFRLPDDSKGTYTYIEDEGRELIGACLRTRTGVKPVFVSVGNNLSLQNAVDIVLLCVKKYRLPEPLRLAHTLAKSV